MAVIPQTSAGQLYRDIPASGPGNLYEESYYDEYCREPGQGQNEGQGQFKQPLNQRLSGQLSTITEVQDSPLSTRVDHDKDMPCCQGDNESSAGLTFVGRDIDTYYSSSHSIGNPESLRTIPLSADNQSPDLPYTVEDRKMETPLITSCELPDNSRSTSESKL